MDYLAVWEAGLGPPCGRNHEDEFYFVLITETKMSEQVHTAGHPQQNMFTRYVPDATPPR